METAIVHIEICSEEDRKYDEHEIVGPFSSAEDAEQWVANLPAFWKKRQHRSPGFNPTITIHTLSQLRSPSEYMAEAIEWIEDMMDIDDEIEEQSEPTEET